jgi:general secretion pathway protein D
MKQLRILVIPFLVLALVSPGYADQAGSAYKRGVRAERHKNLDAAFEAYKEAYELKPKNAQYSAAYLRLRFTAANEHIHRGQQLRQAGKLNDALVEFQRAVDIDNTSPLARQEAQNTADLIRRQEAQRERALAAKPESPLAKMAEEVEGPVELQAISTTPINLRLTENADRVYRIIGKLAGLNVLFDPDYRAQRISVELNDVSSREALDMVALQSKTFWQPVSPNTIFVAADTAGKRKDLQGNVMKTFYLENVSTSAELQEAANTLKGILDINRIQLIQNQNALVLRGTPDQMVLAEKLLNDIDKPKAEVVIDIAVMQVSRSQVQQLGTNPPTSASVVWQNNQTSGSGSGGSGSQFTISQLGRLTSNNFLVTIPGASVTALMSDSHTKLLQNPEIRALDNEKATLKIGDRVPVATGSFAPGIGGGSISPLVNTQFQYLDVGVNIDIVPHIHSENEVTLKMVLEISSVTGSQNIGGISQPVIGQRRIEHETRLHDGDVNLVGGILEDSETQSLSGYPGLAKIPILKYLFAQEDKQRRENEIVFAITPHIVRAQDVTEQNLRMVDIGTGSTVGLRRNFAKEAKAGGAPAAAPSASPQGAVRRRAPAGTMPVNQAEPWSNIPVPSERSTHPQPNAPPPTFPSTPASQDRTPVPASSVTPASRWWNRVPANAQATARPPAQNEGSAAGLSTPAASPSPRIEDPVTVLSTANPSPTREPATVLAAPGASTSPQNRPSATALSTSSSPRKPLSDPCPYGQHFVSYENNVLNCAFD